MVGLMQIMIYLLSIYLIYKGFEIFQTAYVSQTENPQIRKTGIVLGIVAIAIAVVVGFGASYLADSMAASISDNFKNVR